MKKNIIYILFFIIFIQCKKDDKKWNADTSNIEVKVEATDISKDYYNLSMSSEDFLKKYPFFNPGNLSIEELNEDRKNPTDLKIYQECIKQIDQKKLNAEIQTLYRHIKYYYPSIPLPKIYYYSSAFAEDIIKDYNPITYDIERNNIYIPLDAFLGRNDYYYQGLPQFTTQTMNPYNIVPKLSSTFSEQLVLGNPMETELLNYMVDDGKRLIMQDAFLPDYPDSLKIGFSQKHLDWCHANETNMWNYFLQNNYLFSTDTKLYDRFMNPATPFSKFYTFTTDDENVDAQSPGGVGRWIGWQMMKKYMAENSSGDEKKDLLKLMANTDYQQLFKESNYKPK